MLSFTHVTLKIGDELFAQRLDGEVDSFENPTSGTLTGAWERNWDPSRFVGHVFELEGLNTAHRDKKIKMRLQAYDANNSVSIFEAAVEQRQPGNFGK